MDSRTDLIGHRTYPDPHRTYGWVVEFEYPDCFKTFNGDVWTVTKK